jgi:hypothetical protein
MDNFKLSFEIYPLSIIRSTGELHILFNNQRLDKMIHIAKLPPSVWNIHNYEYCDSLLDFCKKETLPEIPMYASPITMEQLMIEVIKYLRKKYNVFEYDSEFTSVSNVSLFQKKFDFPMSVISEYSMSPYLKSILDENPTHFEICGHHGLKYGNQMNPEFAYQMMVDYAHHLIEFKETGQPIAHGEVNISKPYLELLGDSYLLMIKYYQFCIEDDSKGSLTSLIFNPAFSLYMLDITEDIFDKYKIIGLCEKIYMLQAKILCNFGERHVEIAFEAYSSIMTHRT